MMEYASVSKWMGWWGGWGSEGDVSAILNGYAADGWRLVRSESGVFAWMLFMPRHKVLFVFEREAPVAAPVA